MINGIGNGIGFNVSRMSYAQKLAKAYRDRVLADGGVVESLQCFTNFAKALGAQPYVVVALSATTVTSDSFVANWSAISGASYYLLDVSIDPNFGSFVLQNQVVNTNTYTVTGLTQNTTYYYRVRVYA